MMVEQRKKRVSIRLKVAAAILIILLISIGLSIFISVTNQRNNLLATKQADLVTSNNILNEVVRNIMLSGEAPIAVSTFSDIRGVQGFEQIEIYRRTGEIAFSDYSTLNEVNRRLEDRMFEETPRLDTKTIDTPEFRDVIMTNTPVYKEDFQNERMNYYFPILNYADCRGCHGTDHFIRGVAFYEVSLSEAFDQIESARNILILFFTATGIAIAVILILLMQRIVIKPILGIGAVVTDVGAGELDVQAEVSSSDELGVLSDKINSMISGLKEKRELEIENRVIETRNQENRKYLDNINEGLLLINRDMTISNQYSTFLTQLFATGDIAGRDFAEFIYPQAGPEDPERQELKRFIDMIFTKTNTELEMIMAVNPLSDITLTVEGDEERKKIVVDTDFQRIYRNGKIENVMVIFTDKTDIVRVQKELEQEKQRSASELEHIAALLKSGPQAFIEFEEDARSILREIAAATAGTPGEDFHAKAMRELHSLKGSARYLEFRHIASIANSFEEIFVELKEGKRTWNDQTVSAVKDKVEEIYRELEGIRELNEKFKDFVTGVDSAQPGHNEFDDFLRNLKKMTESIGEEMGKDIEVLIVNKLHEFPYLKSLRNALIHLARNAADHGIEDELERVSAGKTEAPKIKFRFAKKDDNYIVTVTDNGGGIDFNAVYGKAKDKGLLESERGDYTEKELLQLLFTPDFSTRDDATEISGRGAGLDAVRADVMKAGGKLAVTTDKGKGTRFTITLPDPGGNS